MKSPVTLAVLAPVTSTLVERKVMAGYWPASSQSLPRSSVLNPAGGAGRSSDLGSIVASMLEADGLAGSNFRLASNSVNPAV
ncbi:hypothetical protein D3C87_2132840 [compost metagenome]